MVVGSSPTRLERVGSSVGRARIEKVILSPNIGVLCSLNRVIKRLFQQLNSKIVWKQAVWVRIPACPNRGVGVWCNGSIKKRAILVLNYGGSSIGRAFGG